MRSPTDVCPAHRHTNPFPLANDKARRFGIAVDRDGPKKRTTAWERIQAFARGKSPNSFSGRRLRMEVLEERQVMTGISMASGVITIAATNSDDVVNVQIEANDASTVLDDRVRVSLQTPGMSQTIWFDRYKPGQLPISKVAFNGYAGSDQFYNLTDIPSVAHGHAGNDILVGGSAKDKLYGDGGNDMIYGNGGNDDLYGDTGLAPAIAAALAALYGTDGDDYVEGGDGNDIMHGEGGADFLWGGSGNDSEYGGAGNDTLYGLDGSDLMAGQLGDDNIDGGDGNDKMYGNDGQDRMSGGNGADYMDGGTNNDTMSGDDGNDTMYGQAGKDEIFGQAGNDFLLGGLGNDELQGGTGDDQLLGEQGNDVMYGGDGADKLYGGADDDYLNGGTKNQSVNDGDLDTLNGGTGIDYFRFEEEGALQYLELVYSDFKNGVDHKP